MRFSFFLAALLLSIPVFAQSFFAGVPDMPLMPGFVEVQDEAFAYDKPEGRIITGAAVADSSIAEDGVYSYYHEVLPQFGWVEISRGLFERGTEKLEISVSDFDAPEGIKKILEIKISP